jgi:hypothetical protein
MPKFFPRFFFLGIPGCRGATVFGGVDDALAILLALASPDSLCVEGLSIALGNGKDWHLSKWLMWLFTSLLSLGITNPPVMDYEPVQLT